MIIALNSRVLWFFFAASVISKSSTAALIIRNLKAILKSLIKLLSVAFMLFKPYTVLANRFNSSYKSRGSWILLFMTAFLVIWFYSKHNLDINIQTSLRFLNAAISIKHSFIRSDRLSGMLARSQFLRLRLK